METGQRKERGRETGRKKYHDWVPASCYAAFTCISLLRPFPITLWSNIVPPLFRAFHLGLSKSLCYTSLIFVGRNSWSGGRGERRRGHLAKRNLLHFTIISIAQGNVCLLKLFLRVFSLVVPDCRSKTKLRSTPTPISTNKNLKENIIKYRKFNIFLP